MTHPASRRAFLRHASVLSTAPFSLAPGLQTPLALSLAALGAVTAQSSQAATNGYKAVVCLFLAGGNDAHNWVVPLDATGYAQYASVRGGLAWPQAQLLRMTSASQAPGRVFGMPQELQALHKWYEAGQCAVVANVGPLERPTSKAEVLAGSGLPSKLFSHNDQQSAWQCLGPEGTAAGWGGRLGDILMSANANPVFTAISAAGNAAFLSGRTVAQYDVGQDGPVPIGALTSTKLNTSSTAPALLRQLLAGSGSNDFEREMFRVTRRSIDSNEMLRAALAQTHVAELPTAPLTLPNGARLVLSDEPLARQLRTVARLIAAAPQLGVKRQVFKVAIGGFDTHANQMRDQPLLMARVATAIDWFLQTLGSAGQLNDVLLFTASDFGRTLTSNGSGSDHGWGGHHFVAGGAVKGRDIHGRMPVTALGTADDVGSGRLLPSTSVTELAASIGQWMGASASDLNDVLPTLAAFQPTSLVLT